MAKLINSAWDPQFIFRSPMFEPLLPLAHKLADFTYGWPSLHDYQILLAQHPEPILTHHGAPLRIAVQGPRPRCLEEQYASRIYLTGEIQTRVANWHDFFQLLTWLTFPKTKAAINAIHHQAATGRFAAATESGRRSPVENMLSLFDEGGAIVACSDAGLLQMIRDFDWKNLFWQHRAGLTGKMDCIIFGHALYEKALAPYIGMTANSVLLPVDPGFFYKLMDEKIRIIDDQLSTLFINGTHYQSPQALSPLPILGIPGWDMHNVHESYYDNTAYFRPGRAKRGSP
jgi:hypothetical protein